MDLINKAKYIIESMMKIINKGNNTYFNNMSDMPDMDNIFQKCNKIQNQKFNANFEEMLKSFVNQTNENINNIYNHMKLDDMIKEMMINFNKINEQAYKKPYIGKQIFEMNKQIKGNIKNFLNLIDKNVENFHMNNNFGMNINANNNINWINEANRIIENLSDFYNTGIYNIKNFINSLNVFINAILERYNKFLDEIKNIEENIGLNFNFGNYILTNNINVMNKNESKFIPKKLIEKSTELFKNFEKILNETKKIEQRIQNILEYNFNKQKLEDFIIPIKENYSKYEYYEPDEIEDKNLKIIDSMDLINKAKNMIKNMMEIIKKGNNTYFNNMSDMPDMDNIFQKCNKIQNQKFNANFEEMLKSFVNKTNENINNINNINNHMYLDDMITEMMINLNNINEQQYKKPYIRNQIFEMNKQIKRNIKNFINLIDKNVENFHMNNNFGMNKQKIKDFIIPIKENYSKYEYYEPYEIEDENLKIIDSIKKNICYYYSPENEQPENLSAGLFLYKVGIISRISESVAKHIASSVFEDYFHNLHGKSLSICVKKNLDEKPFFEYYSFRNLNKIVKYLPDDEKGKNTLKRLFTNLISLYTKCLISIPEIEIKFINDYNNQNFDNESMSDIIYSMKHDRLFNFCYLPGLKSNGDFIKGGKYYVFTFIKEKTYEVGKTQSTFYELNKEINKYKDF